MTYRPYPLLACFLMLAAAPAPQHSFAATQNEITAALPTIPAAKFNLLDYGAKGDGSMSTAAFQAAIAAIAKAGGGHLIVPAGTFKTAQFQLTSHMDLHLEPGAVIRAPDTFQGWGIPEPKISAPDQSGASPAAPTGTGRGRVDPLISCPPGTTDVAITGSGTIDGGGAMFWPYAQKAVRRFVQGLPTVPRPMLIAFTGIKRLHVDGVTLTNSPSFHLAPQGEDITIENIHIVAPSDSPNTDALDPGGQRIVIRKCELDIGDDNVALKGGGKDILIEDLTCLHGHGISIGSSTREGFSHVIVRRCTFDATDNGLRIKSYRGGGGEVHDIHFSDIVMRYVRRPFDINMLYNGNAGLSTDVGPRQAEPGQTQYVPNFHDITVTNLTVTKSPLAGRIIGIPEQLANAITFTNAKFQSTRGFLIQDAKNVLFDNVQIDSAVGEKMVLDNCAVKWNGKQLNGTSGGAPTPFY